MAKSYSKSGFCRPPRDLLEYEGLRCCGCFPHALMSFVQLKMRGKLASDRQIALQRRQRGHAFLYVLSSLNNLIYPTYPAYSIYFTCSLYSTTLTYSIHPSQSEYNFYATNPLTEGAPCCYYTILLYSLLLHNTTLFKPSAQQVKQPRILSLFDDLSWKGKQRLAVQTHMALSGWRLHNPLDSMHKLSIHGLVSSSVYYAQ